MRKLFLFFVLVFVYSYQVIAVGLSPAVAHIDFEANADTEIIWSVINTGDDAINASLTTEGDLNKYVEMINKSAIVSPHDFAQFHFIIHFPAYIEKPGNHALLIGAQEIPFNANGEEVGVVATAAVRARLYITVPYPGKYAETTLYVSDINEKERVHFQVTGTSYGIQKINTYYAEVTLADHAGLIIQKMKTLPVSLLSQESKTSDVLVHSETFVPGIYRTIAVGYYDGTPTFPDEKEFKIGTLLVNLTNYTQEFEEEKINRFDLELESRWNTKIDALFAAIRFNKDGNSVSETLKTPSIALEPWQKTWLSAFWDTRGLQPGEYHANISFYYVDKITSYDVPVVIKKKPFVVPQFLTMNQLIVILIILILLLDIFITLYKREKRKDES